MAKRATPSPNALIILSIILLISSSGAAPADVPNYTRFSFDAGLFPPEADYDYIIVGGGTAGCPLAATLSEEHTVLLLERGGSSLEFASAMTQEGFQRTLVDTDAHDSPVQSFTSEDGVSNARGRVLGGSSAVNAGFYSRGDPDFFKAENGGVAAKWDMGLVNESYEWVEREVTFRPVLRNWQSAVRDSLLEANVTPYNGFTVKHVVGTKIGGSTFDSNGRRHSAADLLIFAKEPNLQVALRATVERILLNSLSGTGVGKRKQAAIGVVYRDRYGRYHHAMTRRGGEVILCAGALGSPQLLMLSGIGPRPHLSSFGIAVSHDNPYVGQFMYDNPRNGISLISPAPLDHSLIQVVGITESGAFLEAASNIEPLFFQPRSTFRHSPNSPLFLSVATILEKVAGPLSVGWLRLASLDVRENPVVRFNYFSNPVDLSRCVSGVRKIAEVLMGRSLDEFKFPELFGGKRDLRFVGPTIPANLSDDAVMEEFCRRTVTTIWHYHGGCVMGKVVDRNYRVIGMNSLRVVDGSTFSVSPGTNPQATVMMLGRYVGRQMIDRRRRYAYARNQTDHSKPPQ